jgi:NAD(P)-dependent dehydrogenase (short-subunit alcohol dehydrogenase family)
MAGRLDGKVCIITGTGGSMGSAAARMFSAEGAKIVGCDVNVARAEETMRVVRESGGEMVSMQPCNLTDISDCERLVDLAVSTYGGIDVLYNNAAMAYFGSIDQISIEDFNATINEELNLVFLMCRVAWPHLVKSGRASIINTASANGKVAQRSLPGIAHGAAKAGVMAMTRQMAVEGGPHNLRANSISPGLVATYQTKVVLDNAEVLAIFNESCMLGRLGQPEDIAAGALFLASDESSFITGTDFALDGGLTGWR